MSYHQHYSSSHTSKRRTYLNGLMWTVLLALLVVMSVLGIYYREIIVMQLKPLSLYFHQAKTMLLSQKVKRAQPVDTGSASEKQNPVHFEFYSALPVAEIQVSKSNIHDDKAVRTADNARSTLSPFAFSRDELVKEFEDKLGTRRSVE